MPTAIIADDERLMRDQLRLRLGQVWPELDIIGEAKNGEEAVDLVNELKPDLTFLDIRMPGKTGMEAAREIGAGSKLRVVVSDDGVGFGVHPSDGTGLGLPTIRERLKLLHGDQGKLTITANAPSGVIATIEGPDQVSK